MLSVIMLSVVMLCVPFLIAMLSAFMLNVVKPLVTSNVVPGNTKERIITVLLTSCLTGLESAV
jgi:hypothetical protein